MHSYLVVGTPISHSLSPKLHNAVYQELGLARELSAFDPKDVAGFERLIGKLRAGCYQGLCVTIPYKSQAALACDNLSTGAERIGVANYIRRELDGSLSGENTDAQGFASAVKLELGLDLNAQRVVLCGSGGASRAIVDALTQAGAAHITLVSRNPGLLAREWGIVDTDTISIAGSVTFSAPPDTFTTQMSVLDYEALKQADTHFDLLVNATPLGMNDDLMPVPVDWLGSKVSAVYDAVYRKAGTTPLVTAAQQAGIPAADGRSMLIEQAVLGMHFWGIEADAARLRSIIDTSLSLG
jgi:shikimate dehydrogenase